MESRVESTMQTTPQRASFIAEGPIFDNSGMNAPAVGSRFNNQRTFTPVAFDLGSNHSRHNGSYNFNGHHNGEPSTLNVAGVQFGYANGIGHLQSAQGPVSAVGLGLDAGGEQFASNFGPIAMLQGTQTPRSLLNPMAAPVGAIRLNLNENQQDQGSPPLQPAYQSSASQVLEKAVDSMTMATEKIADLTAALLQMEAARQERHEEFCRTIQLEMQKMCEVVAAIGKRDAEEQERRTARMNVDLELQLAAGEPADHRFNWMFGHGVAPRVGARSTKSQAKFERLKTAVKLNALWFANNATDDELMPAFIQFHDKPRTAIDGHYLKSLLTHERDVCPLFALALVRALRKDEGLREIGPDGNTHYVSYKWAHKVTVENGSIDECEELFKEPKTPYAFCGCTKVVAQLRLGDEWAAISIDLKGGISYLIHPGKAGEDPTELLGQFIGLMRTLTMAAQTHMNKLAGYTPTDKQWEFEVALKRPLAMHPNDTGVAAAFYSIPKDGQFLTVSYETICLAKYTFIHTLMKMCYSVTKQSIKKGWRRANMKRDRKGKFVAVDYFNNQLPGTSEGAGGSGTDSHAPGV